MRSEDEVRKKLEEMKIIFRECKDIRSWGLPVLPQAPTYHSGIMWALSWVLDEKDVGN